MGQVTTHYSGRSVTQPKGCTHSGPPSCQDHYSNDELPDGVIWVDQGRNESKLTGVTSIVMSGTVAD